MAWRGALISGTMSALSSLFGSKQQNENVDKQIAATKKENELSRKHNLELAKQQNQWNIDQWNREVQFNDPAAQMARYKAAGLNPNLIYGQSNTAPQLSGSLSSGAPAVPADMSALGNKKSGLSSVFEAIKDNPFLAEQLRGMKLDNDEKQLDIYAKEHEKSVRDWLGSIFSTGDLPSDEDIVDMKGTFLNAHQISALNQIRLQSEQLKKSKGDNRLFDRNFDNIVREVAHRADISRSDAEYYAKTLLGRIAASNEENKLRSLDDLPEWGQKGTRILQILADTIGRIIKLR